MVNQDSNDPSVTGLSQDISNQDIVAEFRLITNQFLPEYGRAAGSVVNIITRAEQINITAVLSRSRRLQRRGQDLFFASIQR